MKKVFLALTVIFVSSFSYAQSSAMITEKCAAQLDEYLMSVKQTAESNNGQIPEATLRLLKNYKETIVISCRYDQSLHSRSGEVFPTEIMEKHVDLYIATH